VTATRGERFDVKYGLYLVKNKSMPVEGRRKEYEPVFGLPASGGREGLGVES